MSQKHITGLSSDEVRRSREQYGMNVLTPPRRESVWRLFLEKFNDPIIRILMAAAGLSLIVGVVDNEYAETIGIVCAIFLATGVSFWFEYDAKKKFEILNVVSDDTPVKVIRDGEIAEIPRKDVVVGDTVVLATGDEVPADGRLVEAVSLSVNESSLTGEQMIGKTTDPARFKKDATYPSDMALRGTTVVDGHGIMEISAVGDSTEYGKVAEQSTVESGEDTPLNNQLNRLSKYIGRIGSVLAISIFGILVIKGLFFGGDLASGDWVHILSVLLQYFMVSVAIMVMAVPEGLPMSITVSLAMSMRRMLKTNNLVRKMHACETMGAVTVICTDKTGTLTRNEMKVHRMVWYHELSPEQTAEMIAVNTTADIDAEGKVIGNPTEGALLGWLADGGSDYRTIREEADIIDLLTFSTERKYMATLVESRASGRRTLYVKGAPEIVRAMTVDSGGGEEISIQLQDFQNKAMRTLGFAAGETDSSTCEEALKEKGLTFLAVAAISDPVRDEVPAAVKQCLDAGIDIKIVTGDTPATARQIAREIGLWYDDMDGEENEMTGEQFENHTDEQLLEKIGGLKIMSRARPLDKQRLVKLLQQNGEVVAVTGDGTNDAPALNFAQVGLSMGSGTSVAKEASDITLLDDSFKSIATAVMWGRSLYKNIQRFVLFQLTVNFVALLVVFFGSIFGGQLPLTVTQILWVNIIMDTFAAMALASLPPDERVMREKPRRRSDFIITRNMLSHIFGIGLVMIAVLLGLLLYWGGDVTIYQLTAFFTVFVMFHFWNLFNAKSYGSICGSCGNLGGCKGFLLIIMAIIVGQVLIVSFGGNVFRVEPLTWLHWIYIIAGTSLIMVGGDIVRFFRRRRQCRIAEMEEME